MSVRYLPLSDTMLSVEFGNAIDIEINQRVNRLYSVLKQEQIVGVRGLAPTYRALSVFYDPEKITFDQLVVECKKKILKQDGESNVKNQSVVYELPVVYGGEYGEDLEKVAELNGVSCEKLIAMHTSVDNTVYMVGCAPGLGYLGADNGIKAPRLGSPRIRIDEGSVVVWDNQTVVLPVAGPSGWHIIGRSPLRLFDPCRKEQFIMKSGAWFRFKQISYDEFDYIMALEKENAYRLKRLRVKQDGH